jgi:hypothetical protein
LSFFLLKCAFYCVGSAFWSSICHGASEIRRLWLEERDNEVVLKPGVVLEVELYSDAQIAEWDAEDKLSEAERERLLARLAKSRE